MTKAKPKAKPARRINVNVRKGLTLVKTKVAKQYRDPRPRTPKELEHIGEVDRAAAANSRLRMLMGLDGLKEITGRMKVTEPPGGQPGSKWEAKLNERRAHG